MRRLVILGLDGATFDLMSPWAEQGRLPTFARLLDEGAWGALRSVPNMNTAPAWTTFMCGKNPGKHGVFWFAEEGEGAGTVRFVNAADRQATSIWRLLSDGGREVAAVNVPLTYPAETVNGVLLAGFDAPSTMSPGFCYPPGLIDELQRSCGRYDLHAAVAHHASAGRHELVVREALEAEETRVRAAVHLMKTRSWDVFMYMIKSTDQVAHYSWEYGSTSQRWLQPVYEYADAVAARFLDAAGPDCGILVMSDHGMGWRQPAAEYLSEILSQLGYVKRSRSDAGSATWRTFRLAKRLGSRAKGMLKRTLPGAYRRFAYQVRFGGIDWSGTRAYCDNTRSCLWVNLRGRNPNGIVAPEEYDGLIEELREVLLGLVDAETGEPVVEAAWTPEEIYSGPYTKQSPDLQIDWRYDRPVPGLVYKGRLGEARSATAARGFMHTLSGAHRRDGVLILQGPQFARAGKLEGSGLEDIAPTILHLAGLPVPDDMDGRVLLKALAEPYASAPVVRTGPTQAEEAAPSVYTEQEAADLEERLRSLGYL
ncbi:MAG: alkaline phosphatase family protein [Egibacteraceae bacterium]